MLLEEKNAIVYGAGGSIGRAVARAFAAEGAKVHLAGRRREPLDGVAQEIRSAGGTAETAQLGDFERPVTNSVRSNFLTARAAARHMIEQASGVILMFGGYGAPVSDFYLGGFQVSLSAVDALRRQLAAELGPHGIRVLTLQSVGVADSEDSAPLAATALNITGGAEVD